MAAGRVGTESLGLGGGWMEGKRVETSGGGQEKGGGDEVRYAARPHGKPLPPAASGHRDGGGGGGHQNRVGKQGKQGERVKGHPLWGISVLGEMHTNGVAAFMNHTNTQKMKVGIRKKRERESG